MIWSNILENQNILHNFRNTVSFSSSVLASLWSDMKGSRQSKHYSGIPFSGHCCFPHHLIYMKPKTYIILWLANPTESTFINGSKCPKFHQIYILSTVNFPFHLYRFQSTCKRIEPNSPLHWKCCVELSHSLLSASQYFTCLDLNNSLQKVGILKYEECSVQKAAALKLEWSLIRQDQGF